MSIGVVIDITRDGRYVVTRDGNVLGYFPDHAAAREYALGTLTGRVLSRA